MAFFFEVLALALVLVLVEDLEVLVLALVEDLEALALDLEEEVDLEVDFEEDATAFLEVAVVSFFGAPRRFLAGAMSSSSSVSSGVLSTLRFLEVLAAVVVDDPAAVVFLALAAALVDLEEATANQLAHIDVSLRYYILLLVAVAVALPLEAVVEEVRLGAAK